MVRRSAATRSILALAALCACGRDLDRNSVCNSWGNGEPVLGWAPALTVYLIDPQGHPVCANGTLTTRFQGVIRTITSRIAQSSRRVNGQLVYVDPRETGCYNVHFSPGPYWPCTDDVLEIEVNIPACRPRTLRLTWWDNERLYGGLGAPWWNIPIELQCEESAVTPPADASSAPTDAAVDRPG